MATYLSRACGQQQSLLRLFFSSSSSSSFSTSSFEHLKLDEPSPHVAHVQMNRPEKRNAMNRKLWSEIGTCFNELSDDSSCRAIVLSAAGSIFTAGIDLNLLMEGGQFEEDADIARRCKKLHGFVLWFQEQFSALEKCEKPVIAAISGGCLGAGVDLITAADIRMCSKDAWFCIKEIEMGLAADVGTLQRLPRVVGNQSFVRDVCLTARRFDAEEARREGLVSGQLFEDKESLLSGAFSTAKAIAEKSPVAAHGTKHFLVRSVNGSGSVQDDLRYIARWNSALLQSEDVVKSAMAAMAKKEEPPNFEKY